MGYREIETQDQLEEVLSQSVIESTAFQNLNFKKHHERALQVTFKKCMFLGCSFKTELINHLSGHNFIFPQLDVPFNLYTARLYDRDTLLGEYRVGHPESYKDTRDYIVYSHFKKQGEEAKNIYETLARRLHDHSITDALYDFLDNYEERKIVGIMGGHNLSRGEGHFKTIALLSKKLTENGALMVSGGGPGAMEATHFGAWFAGKDMNDFEEALKILSKAPTYQHPEWMDLAFRVIDMFPGNKYESLGVPTWLYGHEPPTPFATKIAKYFANSVREDGLLTIAKGGIVFAPGGAGTIQEIFQ